MGRSYEYFLMNIAPDTSEETLLEHLRLNLKSKLKDQGFLFGKTTLFSCKEKLGYDDWENCEKLGGQCLMLVYKKSNKKVQFSDRFMDRFRTCSRKQTRDKDKTYVDNNRKTYHRVQLSGPWTEIFVVLEQLPDSNQDSQQSIQDETKRPLSAKSNRTDKNTNLPERHLDVVPQVIWPQCDSSKTESLDIEEDLHSYMKKHHTSEMERILNPKPFVYDFRSGALRLKGPACLVSKAAEEIAVLIQRVTPGLSRVVYKLSDGINTDAFKRDAESRVLTPNKTSMLFAGSDNSFTLFGPKDKLSGVIEGLKNLESRMRSPAKTILVQPQSGSITPHFQAEQPELMTVSHGPKDPRRLFSSGSAYSPQHMITVNQYSTSAKEVTRTEPSKPGNQQRWNGEAGDFDFPRTREKARPNKITVTVIKGDLRNQRTDVIVNPANEKLRHKGGAAKAIAEAAGPRLVEECADYMRTHGQLKIGQVMHTTAGNLSPPIRYVIHAAGPSASSYPAERDLGRKLEETFFNCLRCANDRLHAKTISIPAISSGIYGASKELVARAAYTALKKFEGAVTGETMTLEKVNFVNIDDESTDAFNEVFEGTRPRKASVGAEMGKKGSPEGGESRSKNEDQSKRKRVLVQKTTSSTFHHDGATNGLSNGVAVKPPIATVANGDESEDCVICMEAMTGPKVLPCGHKFCEECITDSFKKCQPKCPSCGRLFGIMRGNQPPGKMRINTVPQSLKGYEKCRTIMVEYEIPNGIQNDSHPNPGTQYWGTSRTAYLPDNTEGREVCDLLRKAFDAGLIFTVGRSTTTGRDNQVIWNDIHHKTSEIGPYGYPDPSYLSRVKEELKAKGVVSDADDYKPKQTAI